MDIPQEDISGDDVLMSEEFMNMSEELPPAVSQITAHFQQKIMKDVEEMAKLISESAKPQLKEQIQELSNDELEKYKAVTKILNSVLFINNLIHNSDQ